MKIMKITLVNICCIFLLSCHSNNSNYPQTIPELGVVVAQNSPLAALDENEMGKNMITVLNRTLLQKAGNEHRDSATQLQATDGTGKEMDVEYKDFEFYSIYSMSQLDNGSQYENIYSGLNDIKEKLKDVDFSKSMALLAIKYPSFLDRSQKVPGLELTGKKSNKQSVNFSVSIAPIVSSNNNAPEMEYLTYIYVLNNKGFDTLEVVQRRNTVLFVKPSTK